MTTHNRARNARLATLSADLDQRVSKINAQ